MKVDIFNEKALARQLKVQQRLSWDLEKRLPWKAGIDLTKPFLPLDHENLLFPNANAEERLAISQLMGLIIASTIGELEKIANKLKKPCWEELVNKYPVNPEFIELGHHFFEEETKHAQMFTRYINVFAEQVGVDPKDLRRFLPSSKRTLSSLVYRLNAKMGGVAMWWLIAAVEEESVEIFRSMKPFANKIDPLYFQMHKAHYEEELRHKNYALLVLQLFEKFSGLNQRIWIKRFDYLWAEMMNFGWTFSQFRKVRGIKSLKNHHPFFNTCYNLIEDLSKHDPIAVVHKLITTVPYTSGSLHLSDYDSVRKQLHEFNAFGSVIPSKKESRDLTCM